METVGRGLSTGAGGGQESTGRNGTGSVQVYRLESPAALEVEPIKINDLYKEKGG